MNSAMNSAQKILSVWVLIVLLFGFVQCNKIEIEQPITRDTATIVLPVFRLAIDSTGKASFSLDTLLNTYPDFSIRFDPISNGKFIIDIAKREVRFEKNNNNWTRDSTKFELCVGGNCNTGNAVVRNYIAPIVIPIEPEPAGCDTIAPIGPILVGGSFQTIDVTVSIKKSSGKIIEIRNGIYGPHTILPDSTKIRFRAAGNPTYFGYDEVGYTLVDSLGKCRRGIIRFKIGDDCEATDDVLTINGVSSQRNVNQFLLNDVSSCSSTLDGFQFRLVSDRLNYVDTTIFTPNGIATDSTINGTQTFFYKKRNLAATKDSLWYYLYDKDNSMRVTRAKIRINFQ